jgi:hypothetical protein
MSATDSVAWLFLVAKRVVQFGVPIGIGVWTFLFVRLGGLGVPEMMVLVGAPLMAGASLWVIAWIVEGCVAPRGERQH